MEGTGVGRFVEVEITAEDFVGSLAGEHHLDAHGFDDASEEIHRSGGAHGRHIVGFDVSDDVVDGVQSFLDGVVNFVVNRSDVVGDFSCFGKVGCSFESDGEGVEARPPCVLAVSAFHAACGKFACHGRDDGTVETAGEEDAVGHVAHELSLDRSLECFAQFADGGGVVGDGFIVFPVAFVPTFHASLASEIVVSREEGFVAFAESFKCFEFAGAIDFSVRVKSDVERNHADGVACDEEVVLFFVVEREGKDAVEVFEEVDSFFAIEGEDDFAV